MNVAARHLLMFLVILFYGTSLSYAETVNCSATGACAVCDRVDDFDDSLGSILLACHDRVGMACYASGWAVLLSSTNYLYLDSGDPTKVAYRFDKETAHRETWIAAGTGGSAIGSLAESSIEHFRQGLSFASTIIFQIADDEIQRMDLTGAAEALLEFEKRCAAEGLKPR